MFAQLMGEMLNPTTFESFRVYSLDTIARLTEALNLIDDVRRQRVPRAVLEPIAEELEWSFNKDAAALALAEPEIKSLIRILSAKSSFSLDDFSSHLKLITKLVGSTYKTTLENLILKIFDQPNQKIAIRKLAGFYCSHILNVGYSRRFILKTVNRFFFDSPVQRVGRASLSRFFKEFDGKTKKFNVHAFVSKDLGNYLGGLGFTIKDQEDLPEAQIDTLAINDNYEKLPAALEIAFEQFDPEGAMEHCYQILSAQRAISYLDPYGMHCEWGDTMHVTLHRAKSGIAITKGDFLTNKAIHSVPRSGHRARTISNYAREIIANFDSSSTERLLSSIRTAALARTSQSPENRLISLWSAIEVLLSEPRDDVRIVHYTRLIVPCIALRHTRRQVIAVYDELLIPYRHRLNRLLKAMPSFPSSHGQKAFAELMFLPEHAGLRMELCQLLADNPLALHRVWKLHNDYIDIKSAHRTMSDHFDRVRWQVHRVYRARNQLVHSGRMPTYLESVILNLAEYYRSSIATIVNRAKRETHSSDIDQVVAEIGIRYEILRGHFNVKAGIPFTQEHISMLMDFPTA